MEPIDILLNFLDNTFHSDYKIEKELNLTNGNISHWRAGRSKPSLDAVIKLADYFNVSIDYLVGREMSTVSHTSLVKPLTEDEQQAIRLCNALPRNMRNRWFERGEILLEQVKTESQGGGDVKIG